MDLHEYEHLKYELADIVRSAQRLVTGDDAARWQELLGRLAEDRFTVVVAGRFSRGKSSLMNAVLGMERLPTGLVPLTSVVTCVRYGTTERLIIRHVGSHLHSEARLEDLPLYVTEHGNPRNVKRLASAEIQLPAEILRRGFFFVDTPGLGSAILENTEATERILPEIDMLILVTGFDSPMSHDEVDFLRRASRIARAIFVVVNKQDLVNLGARDEVLRFVDRVVRSVCGADGFRLFAVSARDGLEAKLRGDTDALRASGIVELETGLVTVLARTRAQLFLAGICDRVRTNLALSPELSGSDLREKVSIVSRTVEARCRDGGDGAPAAGGAGDVMSSALVEPPGARYPGKCEVCFAVLDEQVRFISQYQLEIGTRPSAREEHVARGGFCHVHTWHYEHLTSVRALSRAYPPLLARVAETLRSCARDGISPESALVPRCVICELRRQVEHTTITSILQRAHAARPDGAGDFSAGLCLPHLRAVLERADDAATKEMLLIREAAWLERLAQDLQRYGVKRDGLRRDLASDEEEDAPTHALQVLAGHRNLNALVFSDQI